MPLETLLGRWEKEGVRLRAPESQQAIEAAFVRAGSVATRDVIELYSKVGGFDIPDGSDLTIWPLSVIEKHASDRTSFGLLFADYLLDCWCFRIQPTSAAESAVYVDVFDGTPPALVAKNVLDFLAVYEIDPKRVHLPY